MGLVTGVGLQPPIGCNWGQFLVGQSGAALSLVLGSLCGWGSAWGGALRGDYKSIVRSE